MLNLIFILVNFIKPYRKETYLCYCFAFFIYSFNLQSQTNPNKKTIDSLLYIITNSKTDSVILKTKILYGNYLKIERVTYWDSIVKQSSKLNVVPYKIASLQNLADVFANQLNTKAADSCLNIALQITETNFEKKKCLEILKQLIKVNSDNLDRKYLLELHYKGIRVAEQLNDKKEICDLNSRLGIYYFFAKQYKESLKIQFNCLKICKLINYKQGELSALLDIGANYYQLKDTLNCVKYYLEGKNYIQFIKGTNDEPYTYNCIGASYLMQFNVDSAKKYVLLSYNYYKSKDYKRGMASALASLCGVYLLEKKYNIAKQHALEALELSRAVHFFVQIPELARILKSIYLVEGDYKNALLMNELYHSSSDSLASDEVKKAILQKEYTYNIEKKESENAILSQKNQLQALQLSKNYYLIIILIIILVSFIAITYLFVKQNRLKNKHQQLLLEQKLLRVQINPHFISNCLAAIQELIYAHNYKKASLYLAKFNFFLRQILNHSEKAYVSLAQELEVISLYIELEQLRFSNEVQFKLHIDEYIDTSAIHIPTLLTQPIIENAIWHGLLPLRGKRLPTLSITVYQKNSLYYIDVIDNGVGRGIIKNENNTQHISKGTQILKDKIANINKLMNSNSYQLSIEDLKDVNGLAQGTKVTIQLTDTISLI